MTSWVEEVDSATAMIGVDSPRQRLLWVGPVFKVRFTHARIDRIEARVVNQKRIVVHLNFSDIRLGELQ